MGFLFSGITETTDFDSQDKNFLKRKMCFSVLRNSRDVLKTEILWNLLKFCVFKRLYGSQKWDCRVLKSVQRAAEQWDFIFVAFTDTRKIALMDSVIKGTFITLDFFRMKNPKIQSYGHSIRKSSKKLKTVLRVQGDKNVWFFNWFTKK